jgi:hypothetical protein
MFHDYDDYVKQKRKDNQNMLKRKGELIDSVREGKIYILDFGSLALFGRISPTLPLLRSMLAQEAKHIRPKSPTASSKSARS